MRKHEHGERGFGGERAASPEYTGGGEAAADRQRSGRPRGAPRFALSGAPDCACAGRRSATSGAGVRAERPASLSMPLRGNDASKSTALKVRGTVARASGGLMYWSERDSGNGHFMK